MIRKTLTLAALAALCAPAIAEASFYRATSSALACASRSEIEKVIETGLSDEPDANERYLRLAGALLRTGRCVFVAEGAPVIIEQIDGEWVRISVTADPRPLWVHVAGIDWSAR